MRTVTNYFIVSLAGADLMMAVLCVPFTFVANWLVDRWPFGAAMCPVVSYLQTVAVFLSAFTLVGLSVDRFRAVVFPLRPRVTARQVISAIAVIWTLALSIPLPVLVVSRLDSVSGLCVEMWSDSWKLFYSAVVMTLQYLVPLLVLMVCYSTICYVIWIKKTPGEAENARDARRALSKRKVRPTDRLADWPQSRVFNVFNSLSFKQTQGPRPTSVKAIHGVSNLLPS